MRLLTRLITTIFFGHSSADHASFRKTINYWHKQIYQAETPTQFNIIASHLDKDAERFRTIIDVKIVNTKVTYLHNLINKRTDEMYGIHPDWEWFYN